MEEIILKQFNIGEEFALHEFNLEYIETKKYKKGIDYEYYKYTGKIDESIQEIILAYNCDILQSVSVILKS